MPFDPDKFLEKYNRPLPDAKPSATTTTPAAQAEPAGERPGIYGSIVKGLETARGATGDWQIEGGHGVAQGLAGVGADVARLGRYISPGLANLAKQVPGVSNLVHRMREFSEEPSESGWQTAGQIGGGALPFMFLPGGAGRGTFSRLGAWLDRVAPKTQAVYQGGGKFARQTIRRVPRKEIAENLKRAKKAGWKKPLAKSVASGAVAGAVGDPEDPIHGAEAGAIAGPAAEIGGRAIAGPVGQWVGRRALPEAAWAATHNLTGMPFHQLGLGPLIAYHYGPFGGPLARAGGATMREAGRVMRQPGVAGHQGGQAEAGGLDISDIPGGILDLARQLMDLQ